MLRRPSAALGAALFGVAALVPLWAATFHVSALHAVDSAVLQGFEGLRRPAVEGTLQFVVHLADPGPFILLGGAVVALALARGRVRLALAIPVVLAGANLTTQILKPALADPRLAAGFEHSMGAARWPSGHATAAMSLALCALLATPARLRPLVAPLGAAYAIGVGYAVLALGWHFPSDVAGGFIVAAIWTLLALAVVWAADQRWPARTGRAAAVRVGRALAPTAAGMGLAAALAAIIALERSSAALQYARVNTLFVVGAGMLALLAAGLAAGLVLALSGRRPER